MSGSVYTPREFSRDAFFSECEMGTLRPREMVEGKPQLLYLLSYLEDLKCHALVVEREYVDRDFLEDHCAYYAKCFRPYSNRCKRLHFFTSGFSPDRFTRYLRGEDSWDVPEGSYLGFVVLKPLPDALVGRTCLASYPNENRRRYKALRRYDVHLAGVSLSVESLAFQEQDTVLAACATTALWSALHRTGDMFRGPVPTPNEITQLATQHGLQQFRVLPSHGLELGQVCRAILSCGLEVEVREGSKIADLRGLIYGYGELGLPAILGIEPATPEAPESGNSHGNDDAHAVTVAGYSLPRSLQAGDISFRSDLIDEMYLHDDQIGPFVAAPITGPGASIKIPDLKSDLSSKSRADWEDMSIFAVIIPVYPKIRIRYEDAWDVVTDFSQVLVSLCENLCWDLRLTTGVNLQAEYAQRSDVPAPVRERVLSRTWPRFIWRATASDWSGDILDLTLDATDIERSFLPYYLLFLATDLSEQFRQMVEDEDYRVWLKDTLSRGDRWTEMLARASVIDTTSESIDTR